MSVPISPHPHQHLLIFLIDIIMDVIWYFMVLLCISVMIGDVEHLSTWGHLYIFFGEISAQILCPFLVRLFVFLLLLSCRTSLYILDINLMSDIRFPNSFSYSMVYSVNSAFDVQKLFHFNEVPFIYFSFISCAFVS